MADDIQFSPAELDRGATFYVAGHRGLAGSAIVRRLEAAGFSAIVVALLIPETRNRVLQDWY